MCLLLHPDRPQSGEVVRALHEVHQPSYRVHDLRQEYAVRLMKIKQPNIFENRPLNQIFIPVVVILHSAQI